MLLSEAITRVREHIDDVSGLRWTQTRIIDALSVAQQETWAIVLGTGGGSRFTCTSSIATNANGVADLSAMVPLVEKILAVSIVRDRYRPRVRPGRVRDKLERYTPRAETLEIAYQPRVSMPLTVGDTFFWGINLEPTPQLDALMCVLAASDLKVKEREANAELRQRIAQLTETVASLLSQPSMGCVPVSATIGYRRPHANCEFIVENPNTLSLVYT